METGSEFGGALGIAVLGSIGAAIHASRIVLPPGLPPAAVDQARETLEGATVVAAQTPGQVGQTVLENARYAFAAGLHGVAMTGALILLVAAGCCVGLLRHSKIAESAPVS